MPDPDRGSSARPRAEETDPAVDPTAQPPVLDVGQSAEIDVGTRLLSSEAPTLRRAVREVSARSPMVTLRVDRVVAFDTSGLGLLLGLHRLARASGSGLVVAGPGPRLDAALRRRGLHRVLVVDPEVPEA